MDVRVQIEASPESLRERDAPSACITNACYSFLPSHDRFREDPDQRAECIGTTSEEEPKLERNAEHPLTYRNVGENRVDQVSGGRAHASRVARWANATALAREGHDQLFAARRALRSEKTVRENSAFEIAPKLPLDVSR
jgi:hypothetical protein